MHLGHVASPVFECVTGGHPFGDMYRLWQGALRSLKEPFRSAKGYFKAAHPQVTAWPVVSAYFVVRGHPGGADWAAGCVTSGGVCLNGVRRHWLVGRAGGMNAADWCAGIDAAPRR
jgi:hypothetical protein